MVRNNSKETIGGASRGGNKEVRSNRPAAEEKYVWLEDLLALLSLKKSIKTVGEAKKELRDIDSVGDSAEKKKKTGLLAEVLKELVKTEDQSPVTAKQETELRALGDDDGLDIEGLGRWMDEWGKTEKDNDMKQLGQELMDKKDKDLFSPEKREEALEQALTAQEKEKGELNIQTEKLIKKLDNDNSPEIEKVKNELADSIKAVKRASVPETVVELEETKKSIYEWTKKLNKSDWKELIDKEPDKDLVPTWIKKMLGDERIEALERKAVVSELVDGVRSINEVQKLLSKGLALEDVLVRMNAKDKESLRKLYKNGIYRDLRETDPGLLAFLERVELINNPWMGNKKHIGIGEGGRREGATSVEAGGGVDNLVSKLNRLFPGGDVENLTPQEAADAALVEGFRNKNSVDFQIFNNVNYKILDDEILEFINIEEWEDSRGGAPAYVKKEKLSDPSEMERFHALWRDRTRLALRKIAYQQSESRQDPVMTELTTLLSIIGIPSSEKGFIKVEMQIYGMVDALMRGEGNAETFAKLFTLFTSNGVGFRLIENLKKNREKVYWVKAGIYAGGEYNNEALRDLPGDSEFVRSEKQKARIASENDPRRAKEILNDQGKELRMGVFDFMRNMGKRLNGEELRELERLGYFSPEDINDAGGSVENIKMMWGTAIYRKSVDADIDVAKKLFMQKVLAERGKTYQKAVRNERGIFEYSEEFEDIYGFYGDYIDEAVYFKAVQAESDGIVGNASLKRGSYEFTQGLKEYFIGKLSIQGARYFEAKYLTGNVDEMVGLLDGGVRSIAVMARTEVVNHFIGQKATTEGNLGASEVFFSKVGDSQLKDKLVKNWNKLWNNALYHHGNTDKVHHDPTNMFTSFGDEKSVDSGLLRPTWNTIEVLKREKNSAEVRELIPHIDYSEFAKIVHDEELSAFLNSEASAEAKFDRFIDRFGEDYRTYTGEKSKRWSDWPVKYWIKKLDEAYGLIQELSSDPYSVVVQKKLLDLYTSTNAGGTPAYQRMLQEAIEWYAKDVGVFGKFKRYKKSIDGDRISMVFDPKKGIYGDDQEFPGIASEDAGGFIHQITDQSKVDEYERQWEAENRRNPKTPDEVRAHRAQVFKMRNGKVKKTLGKYITGTLTGDPSLYSNSLASSYGHGAVGEWTMRQMLLERRGAGFYKNPDEFTREWNKWAKGILWNKDKSLIENSWKWVTFNAPFEYIGMVYFGIQGHKFREIFTEETEKNVEKMLKYFGS